jgi:ABC-type transport system involved in multi-copper enzyme maturation permease subunit
MLFLYLFVPLVITLAWEASRSLGTSTWMMELIFSINPYAMAIGMADPDNGSRLQLTVPLFVCLGTHIGLTILLLTWSALIIRRRARRAGAVDVAVSRIAPPPLLVTPPPLPTEAGAISVARPAGKAPRPKREVSDNPILWRETRRPLLARKWQRVVALCVVVGMLLTLYGLVGANHGLDEPDAQIAWACAFNALFCILTLVISSTAIAQEKESDTWTLLTATSLSGRAIVWGKAIGMMRRLFWPFIFICAHFAIFTIFGVISPGAALLAVWIIFSANTVWIATGVYFSLRFKHVTMAVVVNLLLAISLYLVLLGILGLLSLAYDRNPSPDDLQRTVIVRTILEIVGALIVGYWLFTLYHAFARPRGALGRLMFATLLLIIVLATANSTMQRGGEPIEQAGWYTPYYVLAQLSWYPNRDFSMHMPDREHFAQSGVWLFCWAFGVAHLLVAASILGFASLKFSGIVGRAPQKESWRGRWKHGAGGDLKPILSSNG